jgi:hypothetical protein
VKPLYVIDTCIVVDLHRFNPVDVFPSVWEFVEHLIDEGRCCMPRDAFLELEKVEDRCAPWAKAQSGLIVEASDEEMEVVSEITRYHPDWVQEAKNAADPFVIARAACHGAVIVTHERKRGPRTEDHNLAIPNVAAEYDVECIRFPELVRREGGSF